MRLVHWSADKVTKVRGRRQVDPFDPDPKKKARLLPGKPQGFWVSDESRGAYGWRAWCKAEGFRSYAMRYEHEVKLSDKAKILYLRTPEEIDAFTRQYGYSLLDEIDRRAGVSPTFSERFEMKYGRERSERFDGIDWQRVSKKYHGVIITPYQWSRRLDGISQWYYGWDCASGVIWNARAIESITLVKEHKAPKKPTRWQEKRKHKRQMVRMAQAAKRMVAAMQEERPRGALDDELIKSADSIIEKYGGKSEKASA